MKITGNAVLIVNKATIVEAVREYLDKYTYSTRPTVTNIRALRGGKIFQIFLAEQKESQ